MRIVLTILLFIFYSICNGQDSILVLSSGMFDETNGINLSHKNYWYFKKGNNTGWANPDLNILSWDKLKPVDLTANMTDNEGKLEGWFRIKIRLDSTFSDLQLGILQKNWSASEIYIEGVKKFSFGNMIPDKEYFKGYNYYNQILPKPLLLNVNKDLVLAIHFITLTNPRTGNLIDEFSNFIILTNSQYIKNTVKQDEFSKSLDISLLSVTLVISLLCWLVYFQNIKEKHLLYIALSISFLATGQFILYVCSYLNISFWQFFNFMSLSFPIFMIFFISIPLCIAEIFKANIRKIHWIYVIAVLFVLILNMFFPHNDIVAQTIVFSSVGLSIYYILVSLKNIIKSKWVIVGGSILTILFVYLARATGDPIARASLFLTFPLSFLMYIALWLKESKTEVEVNAQKIIDITKEKSDIMANQNTLLEKQVVARTQALNESLESLKSTQSQLIQAEKMASLGELTAGIAHEIQNPLNFVNNFSEVNNELLEELLGERTKEKGERDIKAENELLRDIRENELKINQHGKRADAIVKSMLQHSRTSTGEKELTDINALCDEYLRIAYHSFRSNDKTFNTEIKLDLDPALPKVEVVPQDIGRILLNLINNAFQAVADVKKPEVVVSTKNLLNKIQIKVKDNGPGISDTIKDKIFQPFFTTKPTGQGTGLGLSLAYDIVKAHGGTLEVESREGQGSTFIIKL